MTRTVTMLMYVMLIIAAAIAVGWEIFEGMRGE